jgi:hypothetical protein
VVEAAAAAAAGLEAAVGSRRADGVGSVRSREVRAGRARLRGTSIWDGKEMELSGGRGGGRGERQPPPHRFGRGAARGAERRGFTARLAHGVTVGAGRVTLERRRAGDGEPRGRHAGEAATPGEGRGPARPRRGKGPSVIEDPAPRAHVRWGRGLLGERACGGGVSDQRGGGETAWLRPGAAFGGGGVVAASEVAPTGGCPRGRRPHGRFWTGASWQRGDPSPQVPATGSPGRPHGGREPATPSARRAGPHGRLREPGILM